MSALALAQDQDGLLWIGTQVGLNRYDGARMRTFGRSNGAVGVEHDVSALLNDPDGGLWVGTLNGLYRFDPGSERVDPVAATGSEVARLMRLRINQLSYDKLGRLWIATDAGLASLENGRIDWSALLAGRQVNALAHDDQGGLYLGTTGGLLHLDLQAQTVSSIAPVADAEGALRQWIQALHRGSDGSLWIGSKDHGLWRWQPDSDQLDHWRHRPESSDSLSHDRVYALLEDRDGRLWIGTEAGADLLVDRSRPGQGIQRFQHRSGQRGSIGAGRIVSLMQDRAGDLWFGSWSGGASLLAVMRSQFLSFSANAAVPGGVDAAEVVSMLNAGEERLWLGTRRGLFHFDSQTQRLQSIGATAELRVYAVAAQDATLLLGTDHGIYRHRLEDDSLQAIDLPAALGRPYVDFIIVEADRVFVSTRDAELFVLDPGLQRLLAHHQLDSRAHFMTRFDEHSRLLGGDKGLYWFSADGLQQLHRLRANPGDPQSLQTDTCHSFLRARSGALWLATAAGLHRMHLRQPDDPLSARFEVLRNGPDPSTNAIKSLLEDERGSLWMSSNAGITRYDPTSGRFHVYGSADGAIDRGYYAFVYATTGPWFAFGGASGFTLFQPLSIRELPPPPAPLLSALEVDYQLVEHQPNDPDSLVAAPLTRISELRIPPGRARTLAISFASAYFVAPEKLRFAYRLDDFNRDWIETPLARNQASYSNLAPGHYRFRMRARTANDDWLGPERAIDIIIEPHWWQTLWARLGLLLGVALLVWSAFLARLRGLARRQLELSAQVAQATAQSQQALAQMHRSNEELAQAYARIEQLSCTDVLTGLGNRRYFEQQLPALLAQVERPDADSRLAFLLLDLDRFKGVNDRYGHAAGDRLLSQLGACLREQLPPPALVVRWGGEEFLIVVPLADEAAALQLGEALRRRIGRLSYASGNGEPLQASGSIGFACHPFYPDQPERIGWERVLEIADAALYAAKQGGRDQVIGYRCAGPIAVDFEQRLREDLEQLCREGVLERVS